MVETTSVASKPEQKVILGAPFTTILKTRSGWGFTVRRSFGARNRVVRTVRTLKRSGAGQGFQLGSAEGDGLGARQMVPDSTVISVRPDSVRPAKFEPTITSTVPSTRESVSRVGSMK